MDKTLSESEKLLQEQQINKSHLEERLIEQERIRLLEEKREKARLKREEKRRRLEENGSVERKRRGVTNVAVLKEYSHSSQLICVNIYSDLKRNFSLGSSSA